MIERANDIAWRQLNKKYKIVDVVDNQGYFRIDASQIKEFREPRLMTKFDYAFELPSLFQENKLSILAEKRGTYIIGRFETFQPIDINFDSQISHVEMPDYLQSIDLHRITSGSVALNAAFNAGIISDFLGEEIFPTVSGRQSSGTFSYEIAMLEGGELKINVENAQIEIDAGYEGPESLALVKAKLDLSEDFMLRQLYYPYRTWTNKINKKVRPIFFVYANRTFFLYEYEFENSNHYSSARIIQKARYGIEPTYISFDEIQSVFDNTRIMPEPEVPFPQANSMERILNLCERLDFRNLEQGEISEAYEFVNRQAQYYSAAAEYLGLVKKDRNGHVVLDTYGIDYLSKSYRDARLFICERLFEHKPFNEVFKLIICKGEIPDKETVASIIEKNTKYSGSTPLRRASTVISWIRWVCALTYEEY